MDPMFDRRQIGVKLNTFAKLNESLVGTMTRTLTQFRNDITRRSEYVRELIGQRLQNAGSKLSVAGPALYDRPFSRLFELIVKLCEVACESRGKQLATLRTCAVVACPAPTFAIETLVTTA